MLSMLHVFCACLCLSFHPLVTADDLDHATFEGAVTDAAGGALARARVTARHAATGGERSAESDAAGRYRLPALAPGVYDVRVELAGFRGPRYVGVGAGAGATVRRDFRLEPAPLEVRVTVSADADEASVDPARTTVGGTLGRAQVDALPLEGRNVYDLIFTLPGAAPEALSVRHLAEGEPGDRFRETPEESGGFALNGGTPFSNNLTVEGFDNNDDRAARERFIPSADAVEELQVVANQFSAEYGRAAGGRVNVRLRGGGQQFRGRASYYFRDESLDANAFRRNADPARGFRPPFQSHNPGASLGGPILGGGRARAFFFAAYEYDHVYDRAEIAALVPAESHPSFPLPPPNGALLGSAGVDRNGRPTVVNGGAGVGFYDVQVTTPRVAHALQARVDLQAGARHQALAMVTLARQRDERGFPGGRRTLDTLRRTGRGSEAVALADTFIVSPRAVSQLRLQFSRLTPADAPPGARPVVIIDIDDPRDVPGDPNANSLTRAGTLLAGSSTIGGTDRREERWQAQQTLSYARSRHSLRAGADVQLICSRFIDLEDATGTFNFASPADFLAGRPARYRHRFDTESELRNAYAGFFLQDDWRVRPDLLLAFGLRWDNETVLRDRNNFGPRLALAWSPGGGGRTAVRAGYGIFYNRALLRTLDDFLLTSRAVLIDTNNAAAGPLLAELAFPRVLSAGDPRVAHLGVRETGFVRRLGAGFRLPESYQASLGFERELGRGWGLEANYVFSRGLHLWREVNTNRAQVPAGYPDFTAYLLSRDFPNARDPLTGARPLTALGNAELVRFDLSRTGGEVIREWGQTIAVFGLNHQSTSDAAGPLRAARAALRELRPDPRLTQVEELQSRGHSLYHGLILEARRRLGGNGFFRAAYTLSRTIDDGVVNTSSPLVAGDFRRERAPSLLDARHRLALSGAWQFPTRLGRIALSGVLLVSSARPFNIGINGNDRNLDDVGNDRPNFSGEPGGIPWRRPGAGLDPGLAAAFALPTIGSSGDLARNAGRGPRQSTLNLRLARLFRAGERLRFTPQLEAFNPFNATVFSFGAEFVDFTPASLGEFLVPARTVKPRTVRVGLRVEF